MMTFLSLFPFLFTPFSLLSLFCSVHVSPSILHLTLFVHIPLLFLSIISSIFLHCFLPWFPPHIFFSAPHLHTSRHSRLQALTLQLHPHHCQLSSLFLSLSLSLSVGGVFVLGTYTILLLKLYSYKDVNMWCRELSNVKAKKLARSLSCKSQTHAH